VRDAGTLSAEVVGQEDRSADGNAMEALPGSSTESRTWTTERPGDARHALGGLAEIGGERAVEIAGRSVSVVLARGAVLGAMPVSDVALLAVDEGFVLISAGMANQSGTDCGYGNGSRRIILATAESGGFLAPPAIGEQVEALTQSRITAISSDSLKGLLQLPVVAAAIAAALAQALRERQETIRNCAYVRHRDRVREKLLQLGRAYGHVVPGGVRIDFPLTHQLLADMIGSARETVSLALAELAREGFVDRRRRSYVLRVASRDLGLPDRLPV
jgi:CRP-like cAMP-binding protein